MALEFRCQACGQLMSVGDEFAGHQAQCPGCHNFILVPTTTQPMVRQSEWARPVPSTATSSFGEASENPYAAPQVTNPSIPTAVILDAADVMQTSWTILKNRWKDIAIGSLAMGLVYLAIAMPIYARLVATGTLAEAPPRTEAEMEKWLLANILFNLLVMVTTSWLVPGYIRFMLKVCRGESTQVRDIFQGARFYVNFLLKSIIVFIITVSGFMLFIIPGIYFTLVFLPSSYILVDQNKSVAQSIVSSMKITQGNVITSLMIMIAVFVAAFVSIITLVGPIVVMLYMSVVMTVMYLKMSGQAVSDGIIREQPISNP